MSEYQGPDRQARRQALLILLVGALCGAALVWWLSARQAWFEDWLLVNHEWLIANRGIAAVVVLLMMTPILGFCAYLAHLAGSVSVAGQFPPPGQRVTRRTRVVRGAQALRWARLMQLLAFLLAFCSLMVPVMIYMILGMLDASG